MKEDQIADLKKVPKDNDLLFQIDRFKEIINQKNNEIGNIKLFNSTLEKKVNSLEQILN